MWIMHSPPAAETLLNGRRYLYFAGTGYLGLQAHPALIAAAADALGQYGIHTATTRTGYGTSPPVAEVERRAAEFLAAEQAGYLVSGYSINFAICAAIADQVNLVFIDESAHDCLREAVRWLELPRERLVRFRHRDSDHLAELLRAHLRPGWRPLVMTDGVFPISGRLAPLAQYMDLLHQYDGAALLVDDAHGLATLGEAGRGSLELAGIAPAEINLDPTEASAAAVRVYHSSTLSKAVGGHGGVLAGSARFLDRVRRSSGWFRGASAPAAPVAAATAKGLELVQTQPELRRQLAANVRQLREGLRRLGLAVDDIPSPVIGISLDRADRMQALQTRLHDEGIAIAYTRDYAGVGPDGTLRMAVFATHTPAMLDTLVDAFARAL